LLAGGLNANGADAEFGKTSTDDARCHMPTAAAATATLCNRGVPTEEVLVEMRAADPPVQYLVGTPKGV
jgi:hypothetical protein